MTPKLKTILQIAYMLDDGELSAEEAHHVLFQETKEPPSELNQFNEEQFLFDFNTKKNEND